MTYTANDCVPGRRKFLCGGRVYNSESRPRYPRYHIYYVWPDHIEVRSWRALPESVQGLAFKSDQTDDVIWRTIRRGETTRECLFAADVDCSAADNGDRDQDGDARGMKPRC